MLTADSTAQIVAIVFGILWSFAMEYLWFFKDWINTLDSDKKQSVNALGMFIVVAGTFALSMFDVIDWFTKDVNGVLAAFFTFFIALGIAQGVHQGTKKLTLRKQSE